MFHESLPEQRRDGDDARAGRFHAASEVLDEFVAGFGRTTPLPPLFVIVPGQHWMGFMG
jgi:hypothetical protein